jgi:class 3 adenylate cyclase
LPTIQAPTLVIHRTDDMTVGVEAGRTLGALIPKAHYVEQPGTDHMFWVGGQFEAMTDEIEKFLNGLKTTPVSDRVLATVVFTDIVDSTARAEALGDAAWQGFLGAHHRALRAEFTRFGGVEIKSLGEGFLVTFDRPPRAIQCASAIHVALRAVGVEARIGAHTGEVMLRNDDVHG